MATVGSLFSGIGGIDYAFQEAGFRIIWQVEIDPFCQQVLEARFPYALRYTDVYTCELLPQVDVITAGFPCQPFSIAGRRLGEEDTRYLIPEMLRIIEEVKPYVILFENVPGFVSIAGGQTFRNFLGALAEIGYDAQWTHLRASDAGAPHRRERWFCVAYSHSVRRGSWCDYWERRSVLHYTNRNATQDQPQRKRWQRRAGTSVETLANANSTGQQERNLAAFSSETRYIAGGNPAPVGNTKRSRLYRNTWWWTRQKPSHRYAWQWWQPQSRLGRNPDGVSSRLDGHYFPSRPGEEQYPFEAPRTTTEKHKDRVNRLKALGNAVVPQVIYPIALQIKEFLS